VAAARVVVVVVVVDALEGVPGAVHVVCGASQIGHRPGSRRQNNRFAIIVSPSSSDYGTTGTPVTTPKQSG
jgi:hypothetical protein